MLSLTCSNCFPNKKGIHKPPPSPINKINKPGTWTSLIVRHTQWCQLYISADHEKHSLSRGPVVSQSFAMAGHLRAGFCSYSSSYSAQIQFWQTQCLAESLSSLASPNQIPNILRHLHHAIPFCCPEKNPGLCWGDICLLCETTISQNDWGTSSPARWPPEAPIPHSVGGEVSAWFPQWRLPGPLSPLTLGRSTRGTSPISCTSIREEEERHRRLVGMHEMGWTSDLTSKHGAHGKGMKEGTRDGGGTTNREACLGCWNTYHHNIPNSKTACIRTKKQQI